MQRNNGKSCEEYRKKEIENNRRQSHQRDRERENRDYTHTRPGLSRYCNPDPEEKSEEFDAYHQQQLQQQFQEFQLARKENSQSRSSSRRMGAVLPSPTPPGSYRSVSVPPIRRSINNMPMPTQYEESEDVSYEPSTSEFQSSNKYPLETTSRSPKNTMSRGNGGVLDNINSDLDYGSEINASTSTSTTNGKVKFLSKVFDKNKTTNDKSEKYVKKEKSSKTAGQSSKTPIIRDADTDGPTTNVRSRDCDLEPYVSNRKSSPPNPFLEAENDTYLNNDPRQLNRDESNGSIKRRSSRQGSLQYVPRTSTNSFLSPSELNSNYDLIYAEARRAVGRQENMLSQENSTEVLPLPLEIPDSVTDEEAFRRYLTVRRGATCNHHLAHLPLPPFLSVPNSQQLANVGSTGERRGSSKSPSRRAAMTENQDKCLMLPPGEAHKRTLSLSHAIMTLALLCASASQLRFFVAYSHAHSYPAINYFLVCTCIIIEVVVGIGYLLLSRFPINEERAELIHSFLIFGLFIVAVVNVIICAFALDDHICEIIARNSNSDLYDSIDQSLKV